MYPRKHRHTLDEPEGSFEVRLDHGDDAIEVCVQSYLASATTPSRVAVNVFDAGIEQAIRELAQARLKELEERNQQDQEKSARVVQQQTSRITSELVRMHRRAASIAGDADFAKDREAEFHNKSVTLQQAVRRWPVVRVIVLIISGCVQVNHVVKFMRRKHIY
jgi:ribosomal protein S12 methylthiotransferase accessory factor YcaO